MSDLLNAEGQPILPPLSQETTEWAIGAQKLPPTPGTVEEWREMSIMSPQMPMTVYMWISTSVALTELEERFEELQSRVKKLEEAVGEVASSR